MAFFVKQVRPGVRDVLGEPSAVRERHESIVAAVPHRYGTADLGRVKTPWLGLGEIVVEPSPDAGRERMVAASAGECPRLGRDHGPVGCRYQGRERLVGTLAGGVLVARWGLAEHLGSPLLQQPAQRLAARYSGVELGHVLPELTGEPVETVGIPGSRRSDHGGC